MLAGVEFESGAGRMLVGGYHFVTGEFTSHKSFLPDDEYARGLDTFVKGCSDMLVTNRCARGVGLAATCEGGVDGARRYRARAAACTPLLCAHRVWQVERPPPHRRRRSCC